SAARAEAVQEKINARDYAAADAAEKADKLEEALQGFQTLTTYSDSAERAKAVQAKIEERDAALAEQKRADAYAAADQAEQDGDFAAAFDGFTALGDYKDSAERAAQVQDKGNYAKAVQYAMEGKFSQAYPLFTALGGYRDSAEKAYVTGVTTLASKVENRGSGTGVFQFHDVWGTIDISTNTVSSPQLGQHRAV
ncbi:MAG: hypothetical protein IJ240_05440, partial [Clostridia bacterium]|nr:hypothetical protein [Clostridia bacterium]